MLLNAMFLDMLILNMMFFYSSNNYKTTNNYPITLGEKCWELGVWLGDLPPFLCCTFHPLYTTLVTLCPVLSTNSTISDYLLSNHIGTLDCLTPTNLGLPHPICLQTANTGHMESYKCCQARSREYDVILI